MRFREAFTLVELSVVLTIIAFIVGGIMMGKNLQRSSQVRNVLGDASSYAFAVQQFQQQYTAFPGDMRDAQRVWGNAEGGSATTDCSTPLTSVSTGRATCNGDGDGSITFTRGELYRAWQHLWAAGLVTGSYTGISMSSTSRVSLPGTNVPLGSIRNTGFSFSDAGVVDANNPANDLYAGDYTNAIVFGTTNSTQISRNPALSGKEGYELDKKIDDGLPGLGTIHSFRPAAVENPDCADGNNPLTAVYNKDYTRAACAMIFMNTFQNKATQ